MTHGRNHDERQFKSEPRVADLGGESEREDGPPLTHMGSEVAPTEKAAQREAERHARERQLGRVAGGTSGAEREYRAADVTREDLEEAAREADRRVAGHTIDGNGHSNGHGHSVVEKGEAGQARGGIAEKHEGGPPGGFDISED